MNFTNEDFTLLDTALRLMGMGGALMLVAVLAVGNVRPGLKIACIGLIVGAVAYLINSSSLIRFTGVTDDVINFLSIYTTFWAWIFARLLFERPPRPELVWAAAILLFAGWAIGTFVSNLDQMTGISIRVLSLMLVADVIYLAFSGLADDLIERRRRFRIYLPLLVGFQVGGVLIYELLYGDFQSSPGVSAFNAALILTLITCAGLALLSPEQDLLGVREKESERPDPVPFMSPSETVLNEKLEQAMAGGTYRTPGLTIRTLADMLDTPEHRLRALINQRLGHRNFSSYLNGFRIAEAQQILSDKKHVDLPILTIAMDLGYNSLAPFNRAFRDGTGRTPSDFRRITIGHN